MEIKNFQQFVLALSQYWMDLGCIWSQPYDAAMGAGTFHPHTFLKGIGPEPWRAVYVQPCRRPVDGRYGKSPYRFQHYYQLQVLLKPAPSNIVELFLNSLQHIGIDLRRHDVSLLEDDWKGPTLGAWGLGWEIRANGQEVTQFTYFQQLGGLDIDVVSGEITYGLERLYMYAKELESALDMPYNDDFTYGDIYVQNEFEFSHYNFKNANVKELFETFDRCERNVVELCEKNLVLPAYDFVLQASHTFNLLDARGAISVSERQRFIGRVRDCARRCATIYRAEREKLGFPMLNRLSTDAREPLLPRSERSKQAASPSMGPRYQGKQDKASVRTQTETGNLLFELGVEEMPPSFQKAAYEALGEKISIFLSALREQFAADSAFVAALAGIEAHIFVSARRLAVKFGKVPFSEPSRSLEIWGPAERIARGPDGRLTPAGEGFCRKNGVDPESVTFKDKKDGTFLYAQKSIEGRDLPLVFAEEFKVWCEQLPSPLKMRWLPESESAPFVRPVRWILALVNDQVVPLSMFGLESGRSTSGQRILSPELHELPSVEAYEQTLRKLGVEPSWETRKSRIAESADTLAQSVGGRLKDDETLLDKCTGLSESPHVFLGTIDAKYMTLPPRLVASVLREHMNYFSVADGRGGLLPHYVGVAGYKCGDLDAMVVGTKNVVVGRLDDGAFYYESDLATPISELQGKLQDQLFQSDMGTLLDKSQRVGMLAERIAIQLERDGMLWKACADANAFRAAAKNAGLYCKADLKSGCVQEFPDEMQGVMGGILIREQRTFGAQSDLIGAAVAEHYEPRGATSPLPVSPLGKVLSLADKLDSLSMFINSGVDIKSNKDPYGLRRNAIGVLRLLGLEATDTDAVELPLEKVVRLSLEVLEASGVRVKADSFGKVVGFIVGRLKASWKGEYDPGAVESVSGKFDAFSLPNARSLVAATSLALSKTGKGSLLEALVPYRRCRNLAQQLGAQTSPDDVDSKLFVAEAERRLLKELMETEETARILLENRRYEEYLEALARLGDPLAGFFDAVMVNDANAQLRDNRVALLARIRTLYDSVADFSLIQVPSNA